MDTDYGEIGVQARKTDDVILLRDAHALGLTDWSTRRLRALSSAHHVPRGTVIVPPVRDAFRARARAAQLLFPDAVLCGITAARLHGLEGAPPLRDEEPIHLALPPERTRWQRHGIRLHWCRLSDAAVVELDGLRVTNVESTLLQLQRQIDRRRFVCLADSAIRLEQLSAMRVEELIRDLPRTRANAWRLVDGRAESPSESVVRLVLIDAYLTPEELQLRVFDDEDQFVARLDMGWRRARVGLEVDSAVHDEPEALYRDRYRQNRLVALGWTILRVTVADAWSRPAYVQALVRGALESSER